MGVCAVSFYKVMQYIHLYYFSHLYCHVEQETLKEEMALVGEVVHNK